MRPSSGSLSPAMQSSSVVFPAPEAPKRIVKPASARKWTFRLKLFSGFGKRFRMRTSRSAEIGCGVAGDDNDDDGEFDSDDEGDGVCALRLVFIAMGPPSTGGGSSRTDSSRTQSTELRMRRSAGPAPSDSRSNNLPFAPDRKYQSRWCGSLRECCLPP